MERTLNIITWKGGTLRIRWRIFRCPVGDSDITSKVQLEQNSHHGFMDWVSEDNFQVSTSAKQDHGFMDWVSEDNFQVSTRARQDHGFMDWVSEDDFQVSSRAKQHHKFVDSFPEDGVQITARAKQHHRLVNCGGRSCACHYVVLLWEWNSNVA